jgi:hypothetical protein
VIVIRHGEPHLTQECALRTTTDTTGRQGMAFNSSHPDCASPLSMRACGLLATMGRRERCGDDDDLGPGVTKPDEIPEIIEEFAADPSDACGRGRAVRGTGQGRP